VLAWSLMLAVDMVCGLVMFELYPYTNTREYGISSARKSFGQNFPLAWVHVSNGWSFRPRGFRPWTKTKLLGYGLIDRRILRRVETYRVLDLMSLSRSIDLLQEWKLVLCRILRLM
jgi:hypothetical protein